MIKMYLESDLVNGKVNEECPSNMEIKQVVLIDKSVGMYAVVYGEKLGERLRDIHTDLHTMI